MNASDSEQNEMISPSAVAGRHLREAREALGLSRDDVARELRLQEKLIGALEEGDRNQLPPTAFISGYLRAYTRLLGLPAEQLIADYLAERVEPSLYRATDRTGVQISSSRDPKFRLMTYAVIAVSVLLFAAWWANQRFSFVSLDQVQSESESAGATQHEMEEKLPEPMPLYQEPHPEEVDGAPVQPPSGKAASAPGVAAHSTAPATPAAVAPATTVAPATVAPVAPAVIANPPTSPVTQPAKPVQPLPVVTAEPLDPSVPQSTLSLEYQAASWTQVEDANGRVLVYGTINPGRKLQLHGVAPFKVFLGYASGVTVYLNGSQFSHRAYQHGDLARFSVGSSQDNRPLAR